jgi:Glycosyltransferases involved in cell wall biogenesis
MIVIIPAYEPDDKLLNLIDDIQTHMDYDIVLVNDGSSEKTKSIFQDAVKKDCTVLSHAQNCGKGAALKTAFSYLLEHKCKDNMICADCDGQHTWQDIQRIAEHITLHDNAILLGCREFTGPVPFRSRFGNSLTKGIFTLASGCHIADTQTGLRGFSYEMLPWLVQLKGEHYEYEMNQLLQAKAAGYSFVCIPIKTIYENHNKGSHFHPFRDSIRIYLPLLKFSLSSILCGILDFSLLFVFSRYTNVLFIPVFLSRIISSTCNYILNKSIVFQVREQSHFDSFTKYFSLAAGILVFNYLLLVFLVKIAGISLLLSKILTEFILYLVSYFIQRHFVFTKKRGFFSGKRQ